LAGPKRKQPLEEEEKRKLNRGNLKKLGGIFRFMWPYRKWFIVGFVFLIGSSLSLLAFPRVAGFLIDAAKGELPDRWYADIDTIALGLLGILFIQAIFSFLRVYSFAQVSERAMADVREGLFRRLTSLPMGFFDQRRIGELISRITNDVGLLQTTFSVTLAEFFRQILTLLIGTLIILATTTQLTLFMLLTFPVIIGAAMVFGRFIRKLSKSTQDALADANTIVEEALQSVQVVKAFTSEVLEARRYHGSLQQAVQIALKAAVYRGIFISFIIFALFGGIVGVIWYGAGLVQQGEMSVGDLVSFVLYTSFIGGSIAGLGDIYGQVQRAIGATERVMEILEAPEEPVSEATPDSRQPLEGAVTFRGLRFRYPTRPEVEVLRAVDFEVAPGEKVALVGPSGAGKSTVVQLLMRFYAPDQGDILVDGRPVAEYPLTPYRQQIGIVPQEIILFGGSIRENIGYGKPEATEEEIRRAARQANALDFIDSFPEGMQTIVGERGVKLSGGQRQRIAIARALLKDPAILVLDEATSSLDAESEHLVQEALETLMEGRTTIIIAHRLATIRKVDRIFVLSQGRIVERGTHDQLLADGDGPYAHLVRLQLQAEE
jgi:ABC transporter fused permease/ATP-binding protein